EADLFGAETVAFDLVKVLCDFRVRQVDEAVICWRRLDIAVAARQVAQGPGVEPQGPQPLQGDDGSRLSFGGDARIAELDRIQRAFDSSRSFATNQLLLPIPSPPPAVRPRLSPGYCSPRGFFEPALIGKKKPGAYPRLGIVGMT